MKVSQLMRTPAVTCPPTMPLREVCLLMGSHRVGAVVVVRDEAVVGIVTDRDVAIRAVALGVSADVPVDQVMTRSVATVRATDDVADAEATMSSRQVRRLPVVDDHGRLHGMIALDDLMRHIGHEADDLGRVLAHQADGG